MPRTSKPVAADARTLDWEDVATDDWLRRKVAQSLDDPGADIPAGEVFRDLRAHHARRLKRGARSRPPRAP